MVVWEKFIGFFQDLINKLIVWYNNLPAEKKRFFIIIGTSVFAVLLAFSVILSIFNTDKKENPGEPERARINLPIPAEELFLPDEPDFLPGVLLERDRRESWSEQDANEYWLDPLRSGEEQWREMIETAIDEFLERIP